MNHTPNYQLSQWAKSDRVLMDDFNADNAKIDAALAGLDSRADAIAASVPDIRFGSYTGDGADNRFIDLGLTPKAVLLMSQNGRTFHQFSIPLVSGGLFLQDEPLVNRTNRGATHIVARIVENGFIVSQYVDSDCQNQANAQNEKYYYILFS